MTVPERSRVVQAIRDNLPKTILDKRIWLAYYFRENKDGTYSKPPVAGYSVMPTEPSYTFDEVIKDGYPGIKINSGHSLIAFDIDDKEAKQGKATFTLDRIPEVFTEFVKQSGTYVEVSPSGCGIRAFFYMDDKTGLPGRTNLLKDKCLGGELFVNSGYVTVTGNKLFGSDVMHITKDQLAAWYSTNGTKESKPTKLDLFAGVEDDGLPMNLPKLKDVLSALNCCRLDRSAVVRKAYSDIMDQEYNHYDYWIKIMAACHDYVTMAGKYEEQVLAHVIDWSKTDAESYTSEEDVISHWASFTEEPDKNTITYSTLFKFARLMRFNWPKEKLHKGKPTGRPRVNEYANFQYLMDYYALKIYHEPYTNALYISGDEKILEKFFSGEKIMKFFGKHGPFDVDSLLYSLWRMAQDNHYDNITVGTISQIARAFVAHRAKTFNLMEEWLSTPYNELPEELKEPNTDPMCSNVDYLMSCIRFGSEQNLQLAESFFTAFFFGIVMPIYNPDRVWPEHNFMLILTGPENCRKTTFLSNLFPKQLATYLTTHSTETLSSAKSLRDFLIQLTSSALLVVDEFEIFYSPQNDSLFKSLVTSSSVDYTPIYSKTIKKAERTAALAGTTNKSKLPIEQDSSRRLALIDVKFINTDNLKKINWHHFYNYFVSKGKKLLANNEYPWKLSQEQINLQYQENERYRTRSDIEILLTECFDFTDEFPGLHVIKNVQGPPPDGERQILFSRKEVVNIMLQKFPTAKSKPSAVANVLERMCGRYSGTTRKHRELPNCKGEVKNGLVTQGHIKKFIMPPRITDFVPESPMED